MIRNLLHALAALAIVTAIVQISWAAPYFKLAPLRSTQLGAFAPVQSGDVAGAQFGAIAPVLVHDAADGFFLIEGVSWDLVDVGYISGPDPKVAIGPSIHLDEPVKKVLRAMCRQLPKWSEESGNYGLLKAILAPASAVNAYPTLAIGPMAVMDLRSIGDSLSHGSFHQIRGNVQIGLTLNKAFGGGA